MAPKYTTPREVVLVVEKGEARDRSIRLERSKTLILGRTGAFPLYDQNVHLRHAKLFYDPSSDSFVIEDLGNAPQGTWVNGEQLRGEARLIGPWSQIRVGDTVLVLRGPQVVPRWLRPVVLALMLLALVGGMVYVAYFLDKGEGPPVVLSQRPITMPRTNSKELEFDPAFLWEHGISWDLKVNEVYDAPEGFPYSVVYLLDRQRTRIVAITWDTSDRMVLLGDLPHAKECQLRDGTGESLEYVCTGRTWELDADAMAYRQTELDGFVVFYTTVAAPPPPPPPKKKSQFSRAKAEPVKPVEPEHPTLTVNQRLKMEVGHFGVSGGEGELGPFLRSRNIYSPVHYVLCEGDTLPQLLPQVLTDSPGIEAMVPACSGSLGFEGLEPKGTRGQVYGVALTPAGYEAILADVATFYTGEPTGLFVSGTSPDGRLLEEMAAMPRSKSGAKLTALADIQTPQDVVPLPEASVPSEPRRLLESDDFGSVRAPPARVIRLDFPGQGGAVQRIPTGTCEELVVRTKAPRLVKSSIVELGVTPFLTVEVTGCGQDRMLFTVPYVDGVHPVHRRPAGVDVAVRLGVESTAGYRRVYSAEIGYR